MRFLWIWVHLILLDASKLVFGRQYREIGDRHTCLELETVNKGCWLIICRQDWRPPKNSSGLRRRFWSKSKMKATIWPTSCATWPFFFRSEAAWTGTSSSRPSRGVASGNFLLCGNTRWNVSRISTSWMKKKPMLTTKQASRLSWRRVGDCRPSLNPLCSVREHIIKYIIWNKREMRRRLDTARTTSTTPPHNRMTQRASIRRTRQTRDFIHFLTTLH